MAKSPLALMVLKKQEKGGKMEAPEDEPMEDEDASLGDESELAASEDMIAAIRNKDAAGFRDAFKAFLDACGVTY